MSANLCYRSLLALTPLPFHRVHQSLPSWWCHCPPKDSAPSPCCRKRWAAGWPQPQPPRLRPSGYGTTTTGALPALPPAVSVRWSLCDVCSSICVHCAQDTVTTCLFTFAAAAGAPGRASDDLPSSSSLAGRLNSGRTPATLPPTLVSGDSVSWSPTCIVVGAPSSRYVVLLSHASGGWARCDGLQQACAMWHVAS